MRRHLEDRAVRAVGHQPLVHLGGGERHGQPTGSVVCQHTHQPLEQAVEVVRHFTTTTPFMKGCGVQWYVYVPGCSKRCTYEPFVGMIGEPCSVPSNVTECSTGSRLVQRTDCPAAMVTVWPANFMAAMATSAAIAAPAGAPSVTGLGERWNQGLKRFRCSGIVNSKP